MSDSKITPMVALSGSANIHVNNSVGMDHRMNSSDSSESEGAHLVHL